MYSLKYVEIIISYRFLLCKHISSILAPIRYLVFLGIWILYSGRVIIG